jgi:hypothetical protein
MSMISCMFSMILKQTVNSSASQVAKQSQATETNYADPTTLHDSNIRFPPAPPHIHTDGTMTRPHHESLPVCLELQV